LKALLLIIAWCFLMVLCWPLAILAIVLWPLVWVLSLPFRVVGVAFDAVLALLRTVLFLPARLLGHRGSTTERPS
jgi:hypothetical protein